MFNIRHATENDADQIAQVHIDSWRAIYRGLMPDSILDNLSFEKRKSEWQERLRAGINAWVIEDEKKIVGFASTCPTRDNDDDPTRVAEISAIYLMPEYWHQGLGKMLCKTISKNVITKGFKEITLWVLESNTQASRFYESIGFQATGDSQMDHIGCESLRVVRYRKIL